MTLPGFLLKDFAYTILNQKYQTDRHARHCLTLAFANAFNPYLFDIANRKVEVLQKITFLSYFARSYYLKRHQFAWQIDALKSLKVSLFHTRFGPRWLGILS
jgi:hypothetical protein